MLAGKFPHLMVPDAGKQSFTNTNPLESVIDFGDVCIGSSSEKWIEVRNISPVSEFYVVFLPMKGAKDFLIGTEKNLDLTPKITPSVRLECHFAEMMLMTFQLQWIICLTCSFQSISL